eukprot:s251_g28.t2
MGLTCKNATRPDNAIVSPQLVPFVTEIGLLDDTWLATHRPVHFQITLPGQTLFMRHLRFPKSLVDLGMMDKDWDNLHDMTGSLAQATTIQEWGQAMEDNVNAALHQGKGNVDRMNRSFRGRCQPVRFVRCPVMSSTKKARNGCFEPSTEVLTIATRRKVTQVRRLESLHRRLQKAEKTQDVNQKTKNELQQEWMAILRSHSFGQPYLHWLTAWPSITWPDWPIPTADWLYQALQVTRYHTEAALRQDAITRKQKAAYARTLDKAQNSKQAYVAVRGPGMPRVTEIGQKIFFEAMCVPEACGTEHSVYAARDDVDKLDPIYPIALGTHSGKILRQGTDYVVVRTDEVIHEWDEVVNVCQHQFVIAPMDLAKHLDAFWKPIWQRDTLNCDFLEKTPEQLGFHTLLAHLPPHPDIQVDMTEKSSWEKAIKKLKANSARGTDMISAQELKMLPWLFIQKLAVILSSYTSGFPEYFMHGLVCPLSKTEDIPQAHQTRPITVLPQIYRLWAAVMTEQITRVLCQWVPMDVTGLLPGRGATATVYATQFMIEQTRQQRLQVSGLTLDLIKCFNCLRWDFGFHAMCSLGLPKEILLMWILSQKVLTRHWLLQNEVFSAGQGSTGFPEGDHFSVLVMVSIATVWTTYTRAHIPVEHSLTLSAYADNWSWSLDHVQDHFMSLTCTLKLTQTAGVAIDWNKTWCWATSKAMIPAIQDQVQRCLPGQKIQSKDSASDLGF